MKRHIYTLLAWVFLFELCFGEAIAVITGPDETKPGAMFVLDATDSTGDNHLWIPPASVGENHMTCGTRFATAISEPGVYEFTLVMADKEANISYTKHTVTVTGKVAPKPEPDKPGNPPSFDQVRQASRDGAVAAGDARTTQHMIASLELNVPKLADKTIIEAQKSVAYVVEGVLLARAGKSRDADWLTWRVSVNNAVKMTNVESTAEYIEAIEAMIAGLREAPALTATKLVLHYYTSSPCSHCRRWEATVLPVLLKRGIEVVTHKTGHSKPLVPAFEYGDRKFTGYMSLYAFEELAK